jgi:Uma2 family endonuclease
MLYMQEKIDDYLRFGVPYVWIINPRLRKGYIATRQAWWKPNPAYSQPAILRFECPSPSFSKMTKAVS